MRRLIHLAMMLAVLLGCPVFPAWAMPCCAGSAAHASSTTIDRTMAAATNSDPMQGMPSCHHKAVTKAAATFQCAHSACILERQSPAPDPQVLTLSADTIASPALVESRLHPVAEGHPEPQRGLHEPSPPTAMPLPLRV
jgi:hypothetical protein